MPEPLDRLLDDQSNRWGAHSPRWVEDYLAESPWLNDDAEQLLDLIYHEVLLRQRRGETPDVAEYVRRFPNLEAQLRVHFAVHEALDSNGGWPREDESPAADAPLPPDVGRFAMLRLHARGGLGEVFVARDGELPREVAFKRLQPRHTQEPDSRVRFVREAEITSRLEHPGIVPVYGLLRDEAGNPGYAMRLIGGEPMSESIQRLHEATAAGQRRLALRQLLGRFVDACHAVAYAHSQGIVHRDLKPANIMLGPYGETLVIDWGLARELTRDQAAQAISPRPAMDVEPIQDFSPGPATAGRGAGGEGSPVSTRQGDLLGTPAFMSPEQAAGDWDRVGPASDIYSLGATLYVLLTGLTPFADTEPRKLLGRIRHGEFPPPRERRPEVPRALEAICLKALALRPEDRYPTAQALADDIDHWLADEPVAARRTPWLEAVLRFLRRHPAWAAGGTAALVVAAIALTLLQSNRNYTRRQEYAAAVSMFHEAMEESNAGDLRTAMGTYRSAIAKLQPLVTSGFDARMRLAVCCNNLGALHLELAELADAEVWLLEACEHSERLVRDYPDVAYEPHPKPDDPDNRGFRFGLCSARRKLAVVYSRTGRPAEADVLFGQAIETLAPCIERPDRRHEHLNYLGLAYFERGKLRQVQGDLADSEADLREAARLAEWAVELAEDANQADATQRFFPEHRELLIQIRDALAALYTAQSRDTEASSVSADARRCRGELAEQQLQSGRRFLAAGNWVQAEAAFEKAIDLFLEHQSPADREFLADAWHSLGQVYEQTDRKRLAEQAYEREKELRP